MSKESKIFIVSGGTGGHIIPARCLALALLKEGAKVLFLGDKKCHSYVKKDDGFSTKIIFSSQIKKSPIFLLGASFKIFLGFLQSLILILLKRPKYLIAFGGYSTFPALLAALITRTKIILHEQNSHLGKVNRAFAKYAEKICLSFVDTGGIEDRDKAKTIFVGNLVREEILQLSNLQYELPKEEKIVYADNRMGYDVILASEFSEEEVESKNLFKILVLGGSGGAKIFSEILPKAFFNLSDEVKDSIQVIQQCRLEDVVSTFETYKSFNINVIVDSFFENMTELLKEVHLVIARSGSSSIFEFCAANKPMILIPFALSADNHQEKNAKYLEKNNAAIVILQKDFTINKASEILRSLIGNEFELKKLSNNASRLAVLDAANKFTKLVLNDKRVA